MKSVGVYLAAIADADQPPVPALPASISEGTRAQIAEHLKGTHPGSTLRAARGRGLHFTDHETSLNTRRDAD